MAKFEAPYRGIAFLPALDTLQVLERGLCPPSGGLEGGPHLLSPRCVGEAAGPTGARQGRGGGPLFVPS